MMVWLAVLPVEHRGGGLKITVQANGLRRGGCHSGHSNSSLPMAMNQLANRTAPTQASQPAKADLLSARPRHSVLCGLIGQGIQGSLTPALHEAEGAAQGISYVYRLIDLEQIGRGVRDLPEIVASAEKLGFDGLNVTHPCKQAIIPLLTELSETARALGAVNTVLFKDGKRIGYNTDWNGFAEPFRRKMADLERDRVVQLGAGGAAAAVAHAALTLGVTELTIFDLDHARAEQLATKLSAHFGADRAKAGQDLRSAVQSANGLINTTPVGMTSHPGMPLPADLLRPDFWVADIIYFPLETELLKHARALGARTLDGGGMAVFQAVEAFQLFTGIKPDSDRMLAHFAALRPG
jgi:shikimate dehydrogenase